MRIRGRLLRTGMLLAVLLLSGLAGMVEDTGQVHAAGTVTRFEPTPTYAAYNATSFTVSVLAVDVRTLKSDARETGTQCSNATDDDGDGKVNEGCPASLAAEEGLPCDDADDDDGDGKRNDGCPQAGGEWESIVCVDYLDNDGDSGVNDGCPANGSAEAGAQCSGALDDDSDWFVNDGCPAVGDAEHLAVCADGVDSDGDGLVNDGCPAVGGAESGTQCTNAVDDDGDGKVNDGCPAGGMRSENGAECNDGLDSDGDGFPNDGCPAVGAAESACTNAESDDTDGMVNDGCPAVGAAPESGLHCFDALDSDGDGRVNDGCPTAPEPELFCDDAVDDDGDGLVNDGCPKEFDCSLSNPGDPDGTQPCGLGAFQVSMQWPSNRLQYLSHMRGGFITSTGRSLYQDPCAFSLGSGALTMSCFTTGATPLGPDGQPESGTSCANGVDEDGDGLVNDGCPVVGSAETACTSSLDDDSDGAINDGCPPSSGTGVLMRVTFRPTGQVGEVIPLNQTTILLDIAGREIAHVDLQGSVELRRCADVNGSGVVTLSDVLAVLSHVGKTTSSPDWPSVAIYDLNQSGNINLSDALYALSEVGQSCTYTP